MDSLLEQQRRYLEEVERLEALMAEEFHERVSSKTPRERLQTEHRVRQLVKQLQERSARAVAMYRDEDGSRAQELAAMSAGGAPMACFQRRYAEVKARYRAHANDTVEPIEAEFKQLKESLRAEVKFSDEEGHGRFLDLNELHLTFLNLKQFDRLDYLPFLSRFDHLFDVPLAKKNAAYRAYLEQLVGYLTNFHERVFPLFDLPGYLAQRDAEFEQRFDAGEFPGWTAGELAEQGGDKDKAKNGGGDGHAGGIDLAGFASSVELESVGLDALKKELERLGLKCGGNLGERAARLFLLRGRQLSDLPASAFAKKHKKAKNAEGMGPAERKELARLEARVYALSERLGEHREATKENVERKMTRTAAELEEEGEAAGEEESESENEDDTPLYNPKNLPLGWDGKPIPYWLYKLQGLNIDYECEICGNHKYRGALAFQRHFQEWRHSHGMRCLAIPNTVHFQNITTFADAKALWERLQAEKKVAEFRPETEEEFEDSQGNIIPRKLYEDLKKQGLL